MSDIDVLVEMEEGPSLLDVAGFHLSSRRLSVTRWRSARTSNPGCVRGARRSCCLVSPDRDFHLDIIEFIETIERHRPGTLEEFMADEVVRTATIHRVQTIGSPRLFYRPVNGSANESWGMCSWWREGGGPPQCRISYGTV